MKKPIIEIPAADASTINELIALGILIRTENGLSIRE